MDEYWQTVAEVAHLLKLPRRTVSRWVDEERIRSREIDGVTRVELDEVSLLAERRGRGGRLPKRVGIDRT